VKLERDPSIFFWEFCDKVSIFDEKNKKEKFLNWKSVMGCCCCYSTEKEHLLRQVWKNIGCVVFLTV
jgi:hypothetical protein